MFGLQIAVLFLATIVAAVPVPAGNKKADQQFYVSSIPLDPVGLYGYPVGPSAAVPYTLPQQFVDPYNIVPVKNVQAPVKDQVTLMLSVPAVVPPGTSVTVTVNVANKNPETGTVVSVSNPVVSTPGASLTPTSNEAVVIDANTGSGNCGFLYSFHCLHRENSGKQLVFGTYVVVAQPIGR